jgi:hypothetical protein
VTNAKNKPKSNGHAGPQDRTNGHGPASSERGGIAAHGNHAASDDASGASVASAAISAAAGTARDADAHAAPPHPNGAKDPEEDKNSKDKDKSKIVPPGEGPLPASPGDFVEEIHKRIDLFKIWQGLLESKDDKIKQRAVEKLTEMHYKGAAALEEEPQQIVIDLPRPQRD